MGKEDGITVILGLERDGQCVQFLAAFLLDAVAKVADVVPAAVPTQAPLFMGLDAKHAGLQKEGSLAAAREKVLGFRLQALQILPSSRGCKANHPS